MKRSSPSSPSCPQPKQQKLDDSHTPLTHEVLKEFDRHIPGLSPLSFLPMSGEAPKFSDIPIIPPPSNPSSQRSRSTSPSKPSEAQYRGANIRRANICIDDDIPVDINDYVNRTVFQDLKGYDLSVVSERLCNKSKELVTQSAGELEWTEALYFAIGEIMSEELRIVQNRDWREDIKPPVINPHSIVPRKRGIDQTLQPASSNSRRSTPVPSQMAEPVTHPTTLIFKLKDPRPDICIGLSDKSLSIALEPIKGHNLAKNLLFDLQDTSTLITDPHVTPLGLRFPFLIVEAKAAATGGNLYQAQNQAAVGGSAALQIFRNLWDLWDICSINEVDQGNQECEEGGDQLKSPLAFSITTEGPIHELWVHFRTPHEEYFHMACIGTWRTTLRDHALDLVRHILAILKWGSHSLKASIINTLQTLGE